MIIIPARLASTRFPKKILAPIGGVPMVVLTAQKAQKIDETIVAADSKETIKVLEKYGIQGILTSQNHKSGTDRINEAANILKLSDDEIIINVQADEPFIEPEVIKAILKRLKILKRDFKMASCYKKLEKNLLQDPNKVKVITDANSDAIYFSRSKIPFDREIFENYFVHLGIYGFDKKSLNEFCSLGDCVLENTEKLEQLRAIYWGKKISMIEVKSKSFGIDTPQDLINATKLGFMPA